MNNTTNNTPLDSFQSVVKAYHLNKKLNCHVNTPETIPSEKYSMLKTDDKIDPCMDDILLRQITWSRIHAIEGGQPI